MTSRRPATDAASVQEFLRANPGWLAANPELYRVLEPPVRDLGEAVADHLNAMVRAERAHSAAMARRADGVLQAGRAAAGLAQRVQEAVLALIACTDVADCVSAEFPALLAVDAAHLCIEGELPGMRSLPPGSVARLLAGRSVRFHDPPEERFLLHGEAAPLGEADALARVEHAGPPLLLALLARDRRVLHPEQGSGPLRFLGRAVAAALAR